MGPKVSVVVPAYNVEKYLPKCLDSIVQQTYRNLEIIAVDDGSPDRCGEIIDEYARKDKRIIAVHKENGGLSSARNEGIIRATGKWVTFVDSDDWCELEYYEKLIDAIGGRDYDVFCAGGNLRENGDVCTEVRISADVINFGIDSDPKMLLPDVLISRRDGRSVSGSRLGTPWDKLYKTSFLQDNSILFDTNSKSFEDLIFNFQVFYTAKHVGGCDYIGYHYRQVTTSIVHNYNPKKPEANYKFICKLHDFINEYDLKGDIYPALEELTLIVFSNSLHCYYLRSENKKPYKELARELRDAKNLPYYKEAIYTKEDQYMTFNRHILRWLLRLPWMLPFILIYRYNMWLKH